MKYKSNRKQVKKAMDNAKGLMLEAVGRQAVSNVKAVTPVGQYDDGRVGGSLRGSIDYKVQDDEVYVGSTLTSEDYPIYVHDGTRFQASNPYIHNGVMHNLNNLRKLAEKTYQKGIGS